MTGGLILNSLDIHRFRCFRELRIKRLGRVNLIVGKNNVGKSTILEALRLFASPSSLGAFLEILASRDEISRAELDAWRRNPGNPIPIDSLSFGRRWPTGSAGAVLIGPSGAPEKSLEITVEEENATWEFAYLDKNAGSGEPARIPAFNAYHRVKWLVVRVGSATRIFPVAVHMFQGHLANLSKPSVSPPRGDSLSAPIRDLPHFTVGPSGLDLKHVGELWDRVSLSPLEEDVVAALHIISPGIERVAMKASREGVDGITTDGAANRIPFVKLGQFDDPMPLRALGDGVNRLFGLSLALVSTKGGLLLVDEVENGIHYSVQADLWRLIFETASRLNVQVFATTHSYDCIKAFEEAARESEEEGVLIRLARKGDRTLIGEFDERELEVAVEGDIEVR